jgi:hypothetical protein
VQLSVRTGLGQDVRLGGDRFLEVATGKKPAGFLITVLAGQLAHLLASQGGLARLEQAASQLLANEARFNHKLPLVGSFQGALEGSSGAGGVSLLGANLAPQKLGESIPTRLSEKTFDLSFCVGELVQPEKNLLEGDSRLEVSRVELHGHSPNVDSEINLPRTKTGLTDQQVVLGCHRIRSQPLEYRRRSLIAPLAVESSTQQAQCVGILTVFPELLAGLSLRCRPVLVVISGHALLQGARPMIALAPPHPAAGNARQDHGAGERWDEPSVSHSYARHGHPFGVATIRRMNVDEISSMRRRHDLALHSVVAGRFARYTTVYTIVPQSLAINDGAERNGCFLGAGMTRT